MLLLIAASAWGQTFRADPWRYMRSALEPFQILVPIVGRSSAASAATDSCTGNLLFSWHMEDTDVTLGGVAGGVNNGCSAGDTTMTATGAGTELSSTVYKDGAKAIYAPGTNHYYEASVTSGDIVKYDAGTVDLWVYVTTFSSGAYSFFTQVSDTSNSIQVRQQTATTQQFRLTHTAGGTTRSATTAISGGFANDTWYHVIAKWDTTAHGSDYGSICADTTTGTSNCGVFTSALGTWAGDITVVRFGQAGNATTQYIDNVKVYSTWQ